MITKVPTLWLQILLKFQLQPYLIHSLYSSYTRSWNFLFRCLKNFFYTWIYSNTCVDPCISSIGTKYGSTHPWPCVFLLSDECLFHFFRIFSCRGRTLGPSVKYELGYCKREEQRDIINTFWFYDRIESIDKCGINMSVVRKKAQKSSWSILDAHVRILLRNCPRLPFREPQISWKSMFQSLVLCYFSPHAPVVINVVFCSIIVCCMEEYCKRKSFIPSFRESSFI